MKKIKIIVLLVALFMGASAAIAEDHAPASWQVFPIKWELAMFNDRIATDRAIEHIASRVIARLRELSANRGQQECPFVVREDLADFNRQIEDKK